jgi:hypothetical protein
MIYSRLGNFRADVYFYYETERRDYWTDCFEPGLFEGKRMGSGEIRSSGAFW